MGRLRALAQIEFSRRDVLRVASVLVVLLVALELRFTALGATFVPTPLLRDAGQYFADTQRLATRGFIDDGEVVSLVRPPGYSFFASFFHCGDTDCTVVAVLRAQTLVNGLAVVLVYVLGLYLLGHWYGIAAALAYAISPHLVTANIYYLTESLATTLVVVLMGVTAAAARTRSAWPWMLVGLSVGACFLTRPVLLYFTPLVALALLSVQGTRCWRRLAAFGVGASLCIGAWAMLEAHAVKEKTPLLARSVVHGMYPDLMYRDDPQSLAYPYRYDPDAGHFGASTEALLGELERRFTEETGRHLLWFLFGKPTMLWQWNLVQSFSDIDIYPVVLPPYDYAPHFKLTYLISKWSHPVLMLLALTALVLVWLPVARRSLSPDRLLVLRVIALLVIYTTAAHVAVAPLPRYMLPVKPAQYLLAMTSVAMLVMAWRRRPAALT